MAETEARYRCAAGITIAFQPRFVRLTGSVTAALLLSQALYWSERSVEGWFFKSRLQWAEETGLTRHQQDTARKLLRDQPFWQEAARDGERNRLYFRVDRAALEAALELHLGRKAVEGGAGNRPADVDGGRPETGRPSDVVGRKAADPEAGKRPTPGPETGRRVLRIQTPEKTPEERGEPFGGAPRPGVEGDGEGGGLSAPRGEREGPWKGCERRQRNAAAAWEGYRFELARAVTPRRIGSYTQTGFLEGAEMVQALGVTLDAALLREATEQTRAWLAAHPDVERVTRDVMSTALQDAAAGRRVGTSAAISPVAVLRPTAEEEAARQARERVEAGIRRHEDAERRRGEQQRLAYLDALPENHPELRGLRFSERQFLRLYRAGQLYPEARAQARPAH